jgi:hypothetical protein
MSCRSAERVTAHPLVGVTDRHDIDVSLQHDGRGASRPERADDAVPLAAGRLDTREVGVGLQHRQVELPGIDVEPQAVEPGGDAVLQLRLGIRARDAGEADLIDEILHQRALVDRLQHPLLGPAEGYHGLFFAQRYAHGRNCGGSVDQREY